ncbi:uncharacterized protein LOC111044696 [Nilaparvata lugens]|uniref:uncharacterized protein LOC111044696 n=1 Tax=Nilaparvata lugens TaxID=108931 RepID=UPI00193E885A|nr:uncharacterized protein LOC111044696 [Nilaparvata lugens]XP_039282960.1 uncharacterized protein LOC111044696 [Nilaparvata lugens]XP_039282966.1 uncharacterized protein LOC111044696 [Nilaparvata lugens]
MSGSSSRVFRPNMLFLVVSVLSCVLMNTEAAFKPREEKTKCPAVKALRNFDLEKLMGSWYVVQYYASSEEDLSYKCMRLEFSMSTNEMSEHMHVYLNFSYVFSDDPDKERLLGNITWIIPDNSHPAHWIHMEDIYEGVYNTYVLDSDYTSWSLLLHCAEKSASPRYLSSFIMSRTIKLPANVISFLREKLPRYEIDLEYMFPMSQHHCSSPQNELHYASGHTGSKRQNGRRHPMKNVHH